MGIIYRTLHPGEAEALVALRAAVLDTSPDVSAQLFSDFGADARRYEHTFVAVAPDGIVLAAAGYWLREVRGVDGAPQRVGHVYGVATHPDARRQGHAGQLLRRVVAAMRDEGCDWSVLFARDEARSLYARHGWKGYPFTLRAVVTKPTSPRTSAAYVARTVAVDEAPWEVLAAIYHAFNAARPLTLVRERGYWRGYAAWMLADWITHHGARLLIAADAASGQPCAYAITHIYDAAYAQQHFGSPPWFFVSELGVLPAHEEALTALVDAILAEAARHGAGGYSQWDVPQTPEVDAALLALGGGSVEAMTPIGSMMARPIAASCPSQDLDRLFVAPGALFWPLDRY